MLKHTLTTPRLRMLYLRLRMLYLSTLEERSGQEGYACCTPRLRMLYIRLRMLFWSTLEERSGQQGYACCTPRLRMLYIRLLMLCSQATHAILEHARGEEKLEHSQHTLSCYACVECVLYRQIGRWMIDRLKQFCLPSLTGVFLKGYRHNWQGAAPGQQKVNQLLNTKCNK